MSHCVKAKSASGSAAWGKRPFLLAWLRPCQNKFIFPMHRNLGIFTTRNVPLDRLFAQFQGKDHGFTKGRDDFHFGSPEHKIVGMISHSVLNWDWQTVWPFPKSSTATEDVPSCSPATVVPLKVISTKPSTSPQFGIARHHRNRKQRVGLVHPKRTTVSMCTLHGQTVGYGIPEEDAIQVDGNDLFDVYHKVKNAVESLVEKPRPILVKTFEFEVTKRHRAQSTTQKA